MDDYLPSEARRRDRDRGRSVPLDLEEAPLERGLVPGGTTFASFDMCGTLHVWDEYHLDPPPRRDVSEPPVWGTFSARIGRAVGRIISGPPLMLMLMLPPALD